ncbi:MAG: TrkH family potassium uptake protein [Candidatus Omnitrophota bacterium]
MILRPQAGDIRNIGYYLGRIIFCFGITMFVPAAAGLFLFRETVPVLDFLLGADTAVLSGLLLSRLCMRHGELRAAQAMVVVSLSWLAAMVFGAIPLYLSGHYNSFLDTCFETMSGFTTTGLTLVLDLDHMSRTHNLWRHLGPFIGGQGIAIVAVSFLVGGSSGAWKIYLGEARDEKLAPNVINTARLIWLISIVYLVAGTAVMWLVGVSIGLAPDSALFHGMCIFMAGFDTAGFAPQSQNILYYHSLPFEISTIVFMVLGSLNFNLHYRIWKGNFREVWKNLETRTLFLSVLLVSLLVMAGLKHLGVYPVAVAMFRKGFFHVISAHTTTGYMTVYAGQFIRDWGDFALAGLVIAMGLGGCACSTAGGIKMLRAGAICKAVTEDIKKLILPEHSVVVQKFYHIKTMFLDDRQVRNILIVTLGYLFLYGLGTLAGVWYGYPFLHALFESTSAAANVGLSCGITDPGMPVPLKLVYIVEMWAGRLELMSVFALFGFAAAFLKGR